MAHLRNNTCKLCTLQMNHFGECNFLIRTSNIYVVFAPLRNKDSRRLCTYPTLANFGRKMHLTPFAYNRSILIYCPSILNFYCYSLQFPQVGAQSSKISLFSFFLKCYPKNCRHFEKQGTDTQNIDGLRQKFGFITLDELYF